MTTREKLIFPCVLAVAGIAGFTLAGEPLVVAGLALLVAIGWWAIKHDAWQASYAATLLLMAGVTTSIPTVSAVSNYGRFAALGTLMAVTWWTTKRVRPVYAGKLHKRALGAIWFLVAAAAASTLWSPDKNETLLGSALFAGFAFVLHLATTRRWLDRPKIGADLRVALAVLTIVFIASLATIIVPFTVNETYSGRFRGIFENPNMLAQLAAPAIPLVWVAFKSKRKWWVLLFSVPPIGVLLLTQSRTALLAAIIGVAFVILRSGARAVVKAAFVVLGGLVLVIYNGGTFIMEAFSRFGEMEGGDAFNARGIAWQLALDLVQEKWYGVGWQAGPIVFQELHDSGFTNFQSTSVHNSFLQTILELGLFAVIPLLVIVLVWMAIAARAPMGGHGGGLVGVMITGIIIQFAESSIFGVGQAYPYVFWFAVIGAALLTDDQRRVRRDEHRKRQAILPEKRVPETDRLVQLRTERHQSRTSLQRQ